MHADFLNRIAGVDWILGAALSGDRSQMYVITVYGDGSHDIDIAALAFVQQLIDDPDAAEVMSDHHIDLIKRIDGVDWVCGIALANNRSDLIVVTLFKAEPGYRDNFISGNRGRGRAQGKKKEM